MTFRFERSVKRAIGKVIPLEKRKKLRWYFAICKFYLGMNYFPALNQIDQKLLKYVGNIKNGIFVEAGANDGLSQSNTWHLEKRLGWRGLLIEPTPEIAALCRSFRRSTVECCALGSFDQDGGDVTLYFGGLMTAVAEADVAHTQGGCSEEHARRGAEWVGDKSYAFTSPVYALSTLLDKHRIERVDLFSLDVEGFEANVLSGIDFNRHKIALILVETSNLQGVIDVLGNRYECCDKFSAHDYLFRLIA